MQRQTAKWDNQYQSSAWRAALGYAKKTWQ